MGIIHAGQVYAHHSVHMHYSASERERTNRDWSPIILFIYLRHNILDANALWMHINTQSITRTSYTNLHNLITYCITSEHHSPAMLWYCWTNHNQWNIQGNCVILYKQMRMQIIGVIVRERAEVQHGRVCWSQCLSSPFKKTPVETRHLQNKLL